jgi:hypothetical protein
MNRDTCIGILTIAVGAFMFREASELPPPSFGDPVSAGAFPMFWSCLLAGLGALLITRDLCAQRAGAHGSKVGLEGLRRSVVAYRKVIYIFVLLLAQVWLMRIIGFAASSFLFIPICAFVLGANKPRSIIIATIVGAVVVTGLYCFFVYAMQMPLPA